MEATDILVVIECPDIQRRLKVVFDRHQPVGEVIPQLVETLQLPERSVAGYPYGLWYQDRPFSDAETLHSIGVGHEATLTLAPLSPRVANNSYLPPVTPPPVQPREPSTTPDPRPNSSGSSGGLLTDAPVYRVVYQAGKRALSIAMDPDAPIQHLVNDIIATMKLPLSDAAGRSLIYTLHYGGPMVNFNDSLNSAGIPPGATLDIINHDAILGSVSRHPKEWTDYQNLMQLAALNPNHLDVQVTGWAYDGYPTGYRVLLKTVAGPVADVAKARHHWCPPLLDDEGDVVLCQGFSLDIHIVQRYPFQKPDFFYTPGGPLLCHPNVNPLNRMSCLYVSWPPIRSLVESVEKFLVQVSYLGFQAEWLDTEEGRPHILNEAALEWIRNFQRMYPKRLPFRNSQGHGPARLILPEGSSYAQTPPSRLRIVEDLQTTGPSAPREDVVVLGRARRPGTSGNA